MRTITRGSAPLIVLASLLVLAACGGSDTPSSSNTDTLDLVGHAFLSTNVTVNDEPYPLVKGSQLRLSFDDGMIGASAGCNSMGGSATWSDGALVVDGKSLVMTEMGCDEPLMQQDSWFADILTSEPTLLQDGSTLSVTGGDTIIVMTDEEVVVPDATLTETLWQLDSIVTGETASSVPSGVSSTLEFTDEGTVHAALGCNTGRGDYSATDNTLTFKALATTRMACQPPASDVEADVLGVLGGDVSYTIDGESLALTAHEVSGNGASALVYRVG